MMKETRALVEELEGLKEMFMQREMTTSSLENMSKDDFQSTQALLRIMRTFNEVLLEEARVMDSIDNKLDMLLAKGEPA